MTIPFDLGYAAEPFRSLCSDYPGSDVYPPADFRVEWGPIFHRGRLDGSARVLLVGQDPAASEAIARRILVGTAGQRTQGLLAKLGVNRSYVMVNAFLYSVFGQEGGERHKADPAIAAYRERWFDALLGANVDVVIALGGLADAAWRAYATRVGGRAGDVPYRHIPHPTWPESSAGTDSTKLREMTHRLLAQWNTAVDELRPAIRLPDVPIPSSRYGTAWQPDDLVPIPSDDMPAGLPPWMRSLAPWASRAGKTAAEKRATVVVTVPKDALRAEHAWAGTSARLETIQAVPPPAAARKSYALRGRVVTMVSGKVLEDGVVWISNGVIAAVQHASQAAPSGFSGVTPLDTGGSIYPGFMDLHNHLSYNVLPLWSVPKTYANRDKWKSEPTYDQLVKRPLSLLRDRPALLPAICRYVECKSLFGGVTTTQGIRLANAAAITGYFRGFVRNIEMPDDATLPRGESRMPDVAAKDAKQFWTTIQSCDGRGAAYLLHLSEGQDAASRAHFTALQLSNGAWAIDRALAGIHCVALTPGDFATLKDNGGSMVWSPMSNLLLYGTTADIATARKAGLRIALGCDWSPSGSKNLLGEMKVAWLYSHAHGNLMGAEEIVAMVTRAAAEIVRWNDRLGTVEQGKIADLTLVSSIATDPYESALRATERDVRLVVIGGTPRYGHPDLMRALVTPDRDLEDVSVAGELRTIDLEATDPRVPTIRFTEAQGMLSDALRHLPDLEQNRSTHLTRFLAARPPPVEPGWSLALDETEPTGYATRPLFARAAVPGAQHGHPTTAKAEASLPTVTIGLDPPSIADHASYWELIGGERNLPTYVKQGLPALYRGAPPASRTRTAVPRTKVGARPLSRTSPRPSAPR
jgi:5-methylthioadenosine/S-adenosylhomocysteine deaminase